MPAISTSFNRFLCLLLLLAPANSTSADNLPTLSAHQLQWLGERVFASECNSHYACLTSWNEGETFPSLGIGHFIWYQTEQQEVFEETFPALLAWLQQQGAVLPEWLLRLPVMDSPWQSRAQFLQEIDSPRTTELREFLVATQALQVAFIARRLQQQLPALLAVHTGSARELLTERFFAVANSAPPYGLYALIDYMHFKGSGLNAAERYNAAGWGLLQVLEAMTTNDLASFVAAAELVLAQRVLNAPVARNEARWLAGWQNRVRGYLPLD